MKFDSNLLNEAIADAKAVRETAVQTAIGRLKEAFEPTVRQLITQKLSEEGEMPEEETEAMPPAEETNEEYSEETYDNTNPDYDGLAEEDGMPEIETDDEMGLEEILAELEGEMETDEPEEPASDMSDMETETPSEETEKITEADLDAIIAELEGEMDYEEDDDDDDDESEAPMPAPAMAAENVRLRKELTEAQKQLKEAYKAITTQKTAINEVNLLNSKLLFLTKITSAHKLSPEKQVKILEAFDRAQTIREVKLVYATICESLDRQITKTVKNPITESASKPMRSVKQNLNEYAFASRWKELAGIK